MFARNSCLPIACALFVGMACHSAEAQQQRTAQAPPNIVIMYPDNLGYGKVGIYALHQVLARAQGGRGAAADAIRSYETALRLNPKADGCGAPGRRGGDRIARRLAGPLTKRGGNAETLPVRCPERASAGGQWRRPTPWICSF